MKNNKFHYRRWLVLAVVLVSVPGYLINYLFYRIDEYNCLRSQKQAVLHIRNDSLTNRTSCYDLLEDRFNMTTLSKAIRMCEQCVRAAQSSSDDHIWIYLILANIIIVGNAMLSAACPSDFKGCCMYFQTCKISPRERQSDSDSAVNNEMQSNYTDMFTDINSVGELDSSASYLEVSSEHGSSFLEVDSERGSIDDSICCNPSVVLPTVNVISRW